MIAYLRRLQLDLSRVYKKSCLCDVIGKLHEIDKLFKDLIKTVFKWFSSAI